MEKKKRILVVSQHYYPENFRITDLCEGFVQDGFEVDVLCGLPNYPHGEWFEGYSQNGPMRETHGGVEIFRTREIRRKNNTSLRIFLNYVSYPFTAVFRLFSLRRRHYDAVFCYETSPVLMLFPAIVCAALRRIPLTCYVLDLWPENLYSVLPIQNKFLRAVAKSVSHWHYRRCDQLVAMSDALGEKLRTISPRSTVHVIPQYCEDFYAEDVTDAALCARFSDKFCVLFAGNISPAQNLDLLMECAVRLRDAGRNDIHFIIVGDGMSRVSLEERVEKEGVSSLFSFEGQKPAADIPRYTGFAGALFAALNASDDLGLTVPAKITSYLAAGKPCLVSMDGEPARVIREASCGLVSPAGDVQALYENLLKLAYASPEQRQTMGENARRCYRENFSRSMLLKKMEALF